MKMWGVCFRSGLYEMTNGKVRVLLVVVNLASNCDRVNVAALLMLGRTFLSP